MRVFIAVILSLLYNVNWGWEGGVGSCGGRDGRAENLSLEFTGHQTIGSHTGAILMDRTCITQSA